MLKCTLRSPKTIHVGIGKKIIFFHDKNLGKRNSPEVFLCPQIYHLGPTWKQEANSCHGCIRNYIFDGGRYSRNLPTQRQKYGKNTVLTVANPPKKFTVGQRSKCNANGHGHAGK